MGNIVVSLKRFLSNKNTVTILAVIAGIIVLWYFYNSRVNAAITTIRIPYAVNRIDMGKRIETDNIEYKEITQVTTKDSDIVVNSADLEGKYVCIGTSIPAGGFIYSSQLCDRLPNSILDDLPEGMSLYSLRVDSDRTYGDAILPGTFIDLYLKAQDSEGKIIWGRLVESIKVLAVKDSSNKDVFYDSTAGSTASLVFSVDEEMQEILSATKFIPGYSIEVIPMPRGSYYTEAQGATRFDEEDLVAFIRRQIS